LNRSFQCGLFNGRNEITRGEYTLIPTKPEEKEVLYDVYNDLGILILRCWSPVVDTALEAVWLVYGPGRRHNQMAGTRFLPGCSGPSLPARPNSRRLVWLGALHPGRSPGLFGQVGRHFEDPPGERLGLQNAYEYRWYNWRLRL
jgi:hypothetical protein